MATRSDLDGLTLLKGQMTVDATGGQNVTGAHIIEFETTGVATLTFKDTTTDTYTVPNAGTRISNVFNGDNPIVAVTFAGNISWS